MSTEEDARFAVFAAELTELSRRHGIEIYGCGCCGSPSFQAMSETKSGGYVYDESNHGPALDWQPEGYVKPTPEPYVRPVKNEDRHRLSTDPISIGRARVGTRSGRSWSDRTRYARAFLR